MWLKRDIYITFDGFVCHIPKGYPKVQQCQHKPSLTLYKAKSLLVGRYTSGSLTKF